MAQNKIKKIAVILFLVAVALYLAGSNFLKRCYYPPIFMYHNVEDSPGAGSMFVSPEHFESQMKFLRNNGYKIVALGELADMIKEGVGIPHNVVAVTFDDGNVNNYIYAFPILKKYEIPATIFVISDYIGQAGYLDAPQIREMSRAGIEFGSHTKTHRNLKDATKEETAREIIESKKAIEAVTGGPVDVFCYPFGEANSYSAGILDSAGFKAACVTIQRDGSIAIDPYALKRIKVSYSKADNLVMRVKASGCYTWFKVNNWKKKK